VSLSAARALLALLRQVDVPGTPAPLVATEMAAMALQGVVTTGVALLCVHLYLRYRRPWFGWFALAWGVYVARLLCILSFLLSGQRVWLYWHQVTTGWTALALLWAALVFLRQPRPRPAYLGLALFPPLWSYLAIYELDHFLWAALPAVLFLSGATLWTGWVFWRHHRIAGSGGARWLAVAFTLWGVHHLDYPFLRARGTWVPWGYYLDISVVLLVAAGLVLLVLDDLARGVRALAALSADLQQRAPASGSTEPAPDPLGMLLTRPLDLPGVRGTAMYRFDGSAGGFVRGAGSCIDWSGAAPDATVQAAIDRVRVTRRPQVAASAGDQPFVAVLPVGGGEQLAGALVMVGEVRNPFTALDDDFLLALGRQVGAALDQWALDRQLAVRTQALERLSTRMVRQHEEERRRLGRELHDETAQLFSAVKLQLQALRPQLPEASAPRVDRLLAHVDAGIASIREVTSALRPTLLDDLGLRPALHSLVTAFTERSGIEATFQAPDTLPPLPGDAELAIFRALQEALSNVVRHAQATRVEVTVSLTDAELELMVHDNGRGFPEAPGGGIVEADHRMGLTGMRERLLASGGTLHLANTGIGAAVRLRLPRPAGAAAA